VGNSDARPGPWPQWPSWPSWPSLGFETRHFQTMAPLQVNGVRGILPSISFLPDCLGFRSTLLEYPAGSRSQAVKVKSRRCFPLPLSAAGAHTPRASWKAESKRFGSCRGKSWHFMPGSLFEQRLPNHRVRSHGGLAPKSGSMPTVVAVLF
jgi:hypothetical protein